MAPWTVPNRTHPWVGVVTASAAWSMTRDPWRKTLTMSPRWKRPTSVNCCLSSSVVAALKNHKTKLEWNTIQITRGSLMKVFIQVTCLSGKRRDWRNFQLQGKYHRPKFQSQPSNWGCYHEPSDTTTSKFNYHRYSCLVSSLDIL